MKMRDTEGSGERKNEWIESGEEREGEKRKVKVREGRKEKGEE